MSPHLLVELDQAEADLRARLDAITDVDVLLMLRFVLVADRGALLGVYAGAPPARELAAIPAADRAELAGSMRRAADAIDPDAAGDRFAAVSDVAAAADAMAQELASVIAVDAPSPSRRQRADSALSNYRTLRDRQEAPA